MEVILKGISVVWANGWEDLDYNKIQNMLLGKAIDDLTKENL
jgi:hypothetical protein